MSLIPTIEDPCWFRLYEEHECGEDGYPFAWHRLDPRLDPHPFGIKDLVREIAGNRCLRCHHPYTKGAGEWSPCDERCEHGMPARDRLHPFGSLSAGVHTGALLREAREMDFTRTIEAQWRVLTVHHLLTGPEGKRNLRWWNLVSLCQRCHLNVQRRVDLTVPWPWPHTDWFRPYAAGWYAWSYLGENLTREQTMGRLEELLALERKAERLFEGAGL
jgi:5-methylcytosine-specific restriction endonuclease McrA